MMKHRVGIAALCCAVGVAGCTPADQELQATLTVFGASSTRVLNQEFEAQGAELEPPARLVFNNAGSSTLVQQLRDGAPADLLITASTDTMDQAVADATVEQPIRLASSHLVMVTRKGLGIDSVEDVSPDLVVALCAPQVPCGQATENLMRAGGWDIEADTLDHQVSDVLGRVRSGQADVGWVYSTDAAAAHEDIDTIDIPGALDHPNELWGAVVSDSTQPELAQELLEAISTPLASTWRRYGFEVDN